MTRIYEAAVSPSVCMVAAWTIGQSLIPSYFGWYGDTLHDFSVYDVILKFEPIVHVSACVSSSTKPRKSLSAVATLVRTSEIHLEPVCSAPMPLECCPHWFPVFPPFEGWLAFMEGVTMVGVVNADASSWLPAPISIPAICLRVSWPLWPEITNLASCTLSCCSWDKLYHSSGV